MRRPADRLEQRILHIAGCIIGPDSDQLLRQEGYRSVYTTDLGEAALDLVAAYRYEIALIETRLAGMSVFSLMEGLLSNPQSHMGVFAISAFGDDLQLRFFDFCGRNPMLAPAAVIPLPYTQRSIVGMARSQAVKVAARRRLAAEISCTS